MIYISKDSFLANYLVNTLSSIGLECRIIEIEDLEIIAIQDADWIIFTTNNLNYLTINNKQFIKPVEVLKHVYLDKQHINFIIITGSVCPKEDLVRITSFGGHVIAKNSNFIESITEIINVKQGA